MNYKVRMLEELLDLKEKIIKVENCNMIMSENDKKLLDEQLEAMLKYYEALYRRLVYKLEME